MDNYPQSVIKTESAEVYHSGRSYKKTNLIKNRRRFVIVFIFAALCSGTGFSENSKQDILLKIDQVTLVYILSLVVGLLSALAAAMLKNAIHYTNRILTEGITPESGSYFYLAYPLIGMLITLLFVRYIVKDNIGHGVSRVLYAISKKKSRIRAITTWTSLSCNNTYNWFWWFGRSRSSNSAYRIINRIDNRKIFQI